MASSFEVEQPNGEYAKKSSAETLRRASIAAIPFDDARRSTSLTASFEQGGAGTQASTDEAGKLTFAEAQSNFVIVAVGAGIVLYPKVMAENGWLICSLEFVFIAWVCFECGTLILECCRLAEQLSGKGEGALSSFEEIPFVAFGRSGQISLAVMKNAYMLGTVMMFLVMLTDMFCYYLDQFLDDWMIRWCFALPMFIGLSLVTNLKQLARLSPVGTFAVFLQFVGICGGALLILLAESNVPYTTASISLSKIGTSFAVFLSGFDATISLPSIRGQMMQVRDAERAFQGGFRIVFVICASATLLGYAGCGGEVQDNIIKSIDSTCKGPLACGMGSVASAAIMVNVLISLPLVFFVCISFVESVTTGPLSKQGSPGNIAFRVGTMLCLFLIGYLLHSPKLVLSLVASLFGSFNCVFFPLACYYRLRRLASYSCSTPPTALSTVRLVSHGVVFVAGCVAFFFGLQDWLQSSG